MSAEREIVRSLGEEREIVRSLGEEREIVVVGGGPAGCAAAILLRQQGRDVLLLDEATFPRDKVCGESVSPGARALLERLGVASAVRALRPWRLDGMAVTSPGGIRFEGDYPAASGGGMALRRCALDAVLLDGARRAGVEVRTATHVRGLLRDAGDVVGVRLGRADEASEVRSRLVLGCDGRRSVVGRELGLLREHPRFRRFAVRGYWRGVHGLEHRGEMHVGGGGYCGVAPLCSESANVTFVLPAPHLRDAGGDLEGFYRRALARWPRLAERLEAARLEGPPRALGPLALEASGIVAPGAALVGDAAGFYDPFTGEGVTLALRSAALVAETVGEALDRSGAPLLEAYAARRRAETRDKFRFNRLLQGVVAWPALSDAVASRLRRRRALADRMVGVAGDFVPARDALSPRGLWELLRP